MPLYFQEKNPLFELRHGDCNRVLPPLEYKFDMVFADPPYFLSGDGQTIQNGKIVSVVKGEWDKKKTFKQMKLFNYKWLAKVRDKMKDNASIWISGTHHNIHNVIQVLDELDFKVLNVITWEKTNPPPHFACRYFTHSTEQIVWARKKEKTAHTYNYSLMKKINGGKQMKDVWKLPAIARWEKTLGKHPTQKPLSVLTRIILASTNEGDVILDPFSGSSTTGIAANLLNRDFVGIDMQEGYLNLSIGRKRELEEKRVDYINKIRGFDNDFKLSDILFKD